MKIIRHGALVLALFILLPVTCIQVPQLFVANESGTTVSVVSPGSNTIVGAITGFTGPLSIAPIPNTVQAYVGDNNQTIKIINGVSQTVVGTVVDPIPRAINPVAIAVTPDGTKGFVVNNAAGSSTVSVITVATNTISSNVTVGGSATALNSPVAIALTPDSAKGYVCNTGANKIGVLTVGSNTISTDVLDTGSRVAGPVAIAITPSGTKGFVVNPTGGSGAGTVSILTVGTNTISANVVDAGGLLSNPRCIAISPDGTKAYVGNSGTQTISIIAITKGASGDTVTGNVVGAAPGVISSPTSIVFSPDGAQAYVSNGGGNTVTVINAQTDTVIGSNIAGFNTPIAMALILTQSLFPPTNFQVVQECIDNVPAAVLTWDPPASGVTPTGYTIYRDASETGIVIKGATSPYTDANRTPGDTYTYYLVSMLLSTTSTPDFAEITITGCLSAPVDVLGCKTQNEFLMDTDLINVITWSAPINGSPVLYQVYRDAGLTDLAGAVSADGPLEFRDHNRSPGVEYPYYVVAIDASGDVSSAASSGPVTRKCEG